MNLGELAARMKGRLRFAEPETQFNGFATDSRKVEVGQVFLAIQGENFDGHDFVSSAVQRGAVANVVVKPVSEPSIEVENLVSAIGRFGNSLRREFSGPVIGVTGSNGKTTTKEFIAAAVGGAPAVVKSEGNQNTEYTSPLLWERVNEATRAVVVEMGMRGFGQIAHLAEVAEPTVGVITCIGTAHIEMVGSREGIAKAKAELLERLTGPKISVLWHEDSFLSRLKEYAPGQVVTFGHEVGADVRVVGYRATSLSSCVVYLDSFGTKIELELPTIGRHQALNAAASVAVATSLGEDPYSMPSRLASVTLPSMRMQVVECGNATILLDAYNASPDSTIAALKTLAELDVKGRRIAILGEMRELGSHSEEGHRAVGRALTATSPDAVYLVGSMTNWVADEATRAGMNPDLLSTSDVESLARVLGHLNPGDVALVKGSRALNMEKAVLEACQ